MADAAASVHEWAAPSRAVSSPQSWGRSARHYLSEGFGIAKPALADGISVLNRLYEFRGGLVLEEFLRNNLHKNPYLAIALVEAHGVIRDHFGSGTRVILEVVTDPDAPADQQLFIVIRTRFPTKIARDLLSVLRQKWWRTLPQTVKKKMEIDVE